MIITNKFEIVKKETRELVEENIQHHKELTIDYHKGSNITTILKVGRKSLPKVQIRETK